MQEMYEEVKEISKEEADDYKVKVTVEAGGETRVYEGTKMVGFILNPHDDGTSSTVISIGVGNMNMVDALVGSMENLQKIIEKELLLIASSTIKEMLGVKPTD